MKKIFALALIAALVVPTAASAFEVVVPYVLDGGRVFSDAAENSFQGGAAFITLVVDQHRAIRADRSEWQHVPD